MGKLQSHNKLVRDKIPEIIRNNGQKPVTRILDDDEYVVTLIEKLHEEAQEVRAAETDDERLAELADTQAVIHALVHALGKTTEELETIRAKKESTNGGFTKRIFLESVLSKEA